VTLRKNPLNKRIGDTFPGRLWAKQVQTKLREERWRKRLLLEPGNLG